MLQPSCWVLCRRVPRSPASKAALRPGLPRYNFDYHACQRVRLPVWPHLSEGGTVVHCGHPCCLLGQQSLDDEWLPPASCSLVDNVAADHAAPRGDVHAGRGDLRINFSCVSEARSPCRAPNTEPSALSGRCGSVAGSSATARFRRRAPFHAVGLITILSADFVPTRPAISSAATCEQAASVQCRNNLCRHLLRPRWPLIHHLRAHALAPSPDCAR